MIDKYMMLRPALPVQALPLFKDFYGPSKKLLRSRAHARVRRNGEKVSAKTKRTNIGNGRFNII